MIWLACLSLFLAAIPAGLFFKNLALYRILPAVSRKQESCSVLIPARNEETNIKSAIQSALANQGIDLEVIVLDDGSTDQTAKIVENMALADSRVRLETSSALQPGWCGKNFACQQLAQHARYPILVFMDADVRISSPDSLVRLAGFLTDSDAGLVSGVPHQVMDTFSEKLIIPLIHFVLLGFLPFYRMRASSDPRMAAACGQIIAVRRENYFKTGGHFAVKDKLHDAVALARSFRAHGLATDLFDATDTFTCRMYHNAGEVWHGFAKNAHEALATRRLIIPATILLFGGQILPFILLVSFFIGNSTSLFAVLIASIATLCALVPRLLSISRFKQSGLFALLQPLSILILLAIQWFAFFRSLRRQPAVWKGRSYQTSPPK